MVKQGMGFASRKCLLWTEQLQWPAALHWHLPTRFAFLQGGEEKPVTDQWLPPFVIVDDDDEPVGTIEDGDAVCTAADVVHMTATSCQIA